MSRLCVCVCVDSNVSQCTLLLHALSRSRSRALSSLSLCPPVHVRVCVCGCACWWVGLLLLHDVRMPNNDPADAHVVLRKVYMHRVPELSVTYQKHCYPDTLPLYRYDDMLPVYW